jgi:hypothetical protein
MFSSIFLGYVIGLEVVKNPSRPFQEEFFQRIIPGAEGAPSRAR